MHSIIIGTVHFFECENIHKNEKQQRHKRQLCYNFNAACSHMHAKRQSGVNQLSVKIYIIYNILLYIIICSSLEAYISFQHC